MNSNLETKTPTLLLWERILHNGLKPSSLWPINPLLSIGQNILGEIFLLSKLFRPLTNQKRFSDPKKRHFYVPGTVLGSLPRPCVRVKFFDDRGLFFDGICSCAWTGHCGAKKHVDNQHDKKKDAKCDAKIEQPGWADTNTISAHRLDIWKYEKEPRINFWISVHIKQT